MVEFNVGLIMVDNIPLIEGRILDFEVMDLSITSLKIPSQKYWQVEEKGIFGKGKKINAVYTPSIVFKLKSPDGTSITIEDAAIQYHTVFLLLGFKAEVVNKSDEKITPFPKSEYPNHIPYPSPDELLPARIEYDLFVYSLESLREININWDNFRKRINKIEHQHEEEINELRAEYDKKIKFLRDKIEKINESYENKLDEFNKKYFEMKERMARRAEEIIDNAILSSTLDLGKD